MREAVDKFVRVLDRLDDERVETLYNLLLREQAEYLIWEFCMKEYGDIMGREAYRDYIDIAYTTWEDPKTGDEYMIQATLDLAAYQVLLFAGDKLIRADTYGNMERFIEQVLERLDFDDLVTLTDEDIEKIRES